MAQDVKIESVSGSSSGLNYLVPISGRLPKIRQVSAASLCIHATDQTRLLSSMSFLEKAVDTKVDQAGVKFTGVGEGGVFFRH